MFARKKNIVWFLRGNAVWTFIVWGRFIKTMIKDKEHSLGFKVVHISLGLISIVLGLGLLAVSNSLVSVVQDDARISELARSTIKDYVKSINNKLVSTFTKI